jgi:hypothetical protein
MVKKLDTSENVIIKFKPSNRSYQKSMEKVLKAALDKKLK